MLKKNAGTCGTAAACVSAFIGGIGGPIISESGTGLAGLGSSPSDPSAAPAINCAGGVRKASTSLGSGHDILECCLLKALMRGKNDHCFCVWKDMV